ncbi:orotate phosphoribosyltransferase [Campylobacter blaseri]|uniref:Orotate phosphoribosyltransferase n=1 Tax=Campylobacter blaseri TaxID=2042961 RepID=A0A2P8QZU8_9BACT|nr:orotate phosphoribosyltransferase [Campylobacter blaseri]PSM51775.1 orotate phosphoribosyltransferase [Campylobacter blaseri]PSM53566.1 orotate phosphoribosyltransferase [Campylobacter blaseri]QKF86375.1 orotate phosphoribosyltransferase [Campylobacter blaseri]
MQNLIAQNLLEIKAVFLSPNKPFTWASGIKSPIYCDNRLTLSNVNVRKNVENTLANLVKENYPDCQMLMGTATAGIAHAALVAEILNLPMGYVRSGAKKHGRTNQIEGKCEAGAKVVVIEDLISTAGSSIEAVNALRQAGAEVLGIVSIFTYNMKKSFENLKEANITNFSASNLDTLLEIATKMQYINEDEKIKILKFRDNPADESWLS